VSVLPNAYESNGREYTGAELYPVQDAGDLGDSRVSKGTTQ